MRFIMENELFSTWGPPRPIDLFFTFNDTLKKCWVVVWVIVKDGGPTLMRHLFYVSW